MGDLKELKWFEPRTKGHGDDVSIKVGVTSQGEQIYFTFRNGMYALISDTEYIRFAVANNRVYFGSADKDHGYKLVKQSSVKADNRYISLMEIEFVNALRIYTGDYELKYDKERNLYYVGKE